MKTDSAYRNKQYQSMEKWRKQKPLHRYQKKYRDHHPQYVDENRTKQTIRNQKRSSVQKIVKMDELSSNLPQTHYFYEMQSYQKDASGKIVNMDTFIVKLNYLTDSQALAT
jgi:hypothetical protein